MLLPLLTLAVAMPDPTVVRPERLLAPTEVAIDTGSGAFLSQVTKTPRGGIIRDVYAEAALRTRVQVGVLKWLTVSATVPMGDLTLWTEGQHGILRYGDPTFGVAMGPALRNVHVAAFGELTFPTLSKLLLGNADHVAVVATGGVSFVTGAFVYFQHEREHLSFRLSARAAYRLRTNGASDGVLGDLRLELVLIDHLLLGLGASVLVPLRGLGQALISPSRLADSSGYVDATVRIGVRFTHAIDLSAAFSAPVYTVAGGLGLTLGLVATFFFGPY